MREFAAQAIGFSILVVNADVNNPATATTFARSKAIAHLLITKT